MGEQYTAYDPFDGWVVEFEHGGRTVEMYVKDIECVNQSDSSIVSIVEHDIDMDGFQNLL